GRDARRSLRAVHIVRAPRPMTKSLILPISLLLLLASTAEAQISPGGMGGGGMGGPGGGMGGPTTPAGEEKKEGVGEAAPKTPGLLPTTPTLPAQKSKRKKW